jgi:hypothetical protein
MLWVAYLHVGWSLFTGFLDFAYGLPNARPLHVRLACHARLHCASSFDAPWIVGQLAVLMQVRAQSTFQKRVKCRAPGIQTSNIMLSEAMLARCFTLVQLFYIQRCSSCVGPKCLRWCHFLLASTKNGVLEIRARGFLRRSVVCQMGRDANCEPITSLRIESGPMTP